MNKAPTTQLSTSEPSLSAHESLDPGNILRLGTAFAASRVLLSAVELDLFSILHSSSLSAQDICDTLKLHPRSVPDFLDTLYALNILSRHEIGNVTLYSNTPEAEAFLNRHSDVYMGDWFDMCARRVYLNWNSLTDALRTGEMQNEGKKEGYVFQNIYETDEKLKRFLRAMVSLNGRGHKKFAERFDFGNYTTMLDVGGGLGQLSCYVAEMHPHMSCTTFDLPRVEDAVKEHVQSQGLSDRVNVISGDFLECELRTADVITMGMILHDHNLTRKKMLLRKAYNALPDGGAVVVLEMLIDDSRQDRIEGLLMSLNMLVAMDGGYDFSEKDFGEWAREAGFKSTRVMELSYPLFAAIAFK